MLTQRIVMNIFCDLIWLLRIRSYYGLNTQRNMAIEILCLRANKGKQFWLGVFNVFSQRFLCESVVHVCMCPSVCLCLSACWNIASLSHLCNCTLGSTLQMLLSSVWLVKPSHFPESFFVCFAFRCNSFSRLPFRQSVVLVYRSVSLYLNFDF